MTLKLKFVFLLTCLFHTNFGRQIADSTISCPLQQEQAIRVLEEELSNLQNSLESALGLVEVLEKTQQRHSEAALLRQRHNASSDAVTESDETDGAAPVQTQPCNSHEHLRLVGGGSDYEGRLEVKVGDNWMSVCDDGWSKQSARLVCSMLGHPGGEVAAVGSKVFGDGVQNMMPVSSNRTTCSGSAGLICGDFNTYPVRLQGGFHPLEGRVEVYINGEWGTICDQGWNRNDAEVVCRMLGYKGVGGTPVKNSLFGRGTGNIWAQGVQCEGTEQHILQCPTYRQPFGHVNPCTHFNDVGVICGDWQYYPVRLVGGQKPNEGRVEVRGHGQWSTVSDTNWDDDDASVVCKMLGYGSVGAKAIGGSYFGPSAGTQQLFGGVQCEGTEQHLLQCPSGGFGAPYSGQSAGVVCQP